jgi:hypothetical protein
MFLNTGIANSLIESTYHNFGSKQMTLRVKLEIVPFGKEDEAYEIGRLDIFNKGRAEFGHAEYGVIELSERAAAGLHNNTILHRRDLGAWKLVGKAIAELDITGP